MDIYSQAISQIIKQQELIIGPLALNQAKGISGLDIISDSDIKIKGDGKAVLENLVKQYARLFGQASVEVCKDAVKEIKPPVPSNDLPEILR
ncbi:hypothetical protein A3D77_01785 [Candidatus Gottesmanbacteria bacterium RIFCSPHIGHO2_02_FULL_39_11]|uniref:Uncharacterized protein n=1 Tax=Candidatus Gottesmanbacteria bacterium RIFCSPHIGHO2_02_FULL_39_11 TaxID=1798382 RepID=A0A1F5ZTC6_9BACT|nr:MAG: hypothetical protein A3D77_01785 [Candidatus Gottesmanbacteria bacterium RIFCSPHIGHO2_02_FULL_39_11]